MSDATEERQPSAGEAAKGTHNGSFPIGTVEQILKAAPLDIVEEVLPIPEWELSVKVRSFTSAQSARIRKKMYVQKGDRVDVNWTAMELEQFKAGVIQPSFSNDEVKALHESSGKGFQRIIQWLDEKSGIKKEDVRQADEEFQDE